MAISPRMITVDCADPHELGRWWAGALETEIAEDWGDFVIVRAEPVVLGFQRVDVLAPGKNRIHIDFHAGDRAAEVRRLLDHGASFVADRSAPGLTWTVLKDPEHNEFCVA